MAAKGAPIPVGPGAAAARAAAQEDLGEGLVASVLGGGGGGLGGPLRTVETGAESRERQRRARELDELGQRMAFRLRAAKGVALMGLGQYESAAREFIGLEGTLGDWEGRVSLSRGRCLRGVTLMSEVAAAGPIGFGSYNLRHLDFHGDSLALGAAFRGAGEQDDASTD